MLRNRVGIRRQQKEMKGCCRPTCSLTIFPKRWQKDFRRQGWFMIIRRQSCRHLRTCSYEFTTMVTACKRPMDTKSDKKKKNSIELGKWAVGANLSQRTIGRWSWGGVLPIVKTHLEPYNYMRCVWAFIMLYACINIYNVSFSLLTIC